MICFCVGKGLKVASLFFIGKEPMTATLPIRPGYPFLSTLDSLFSEGPVSFAKLAAESSRHVGKKPHTFDFGVSMDDSELVMTHLSRKRLAKFMDSDPDTVRKLMEKEYARRKEKAKLKDKRRKLPKVKKLAGKIAEMKVTKTATEKRSEEVEEKVKSGDATSEDKPRNEETLVEAKLPEAIDSEPSTPSTPSTPSITGGGGGGEGGMPVTDPKPKSRKTARDKFRNCENCEQEISDRIQLCSGCKKVAYCNIHCQKAHWKSHKKTCTYVAQKSAEKEKTGKVCGGCGEELSERVMFCAGCKKVPYCNSACQKTHWKQHKKTCSYAKKKEIETN